MASSFVERHGLWDAGRAAAAAEIEAQVARDKVGVIRCSFVDQHGLLRGKTIVATELPRVLRNGIGCPSSLLLKDTANRTVFAAYRPGGGVGLAEMEGAGDVLLIPDPESFRILPWAPHTGWLLCDLRFPNGNMVPFSTRDVLRAQLGRLAARGWDLVAGAELEFHLFRQTDPHLSPADATQPPTPPDVALLHPGYQYLAEQRYDVMDPVFEQLRAGLQGLGLPLRSLEIEYGPSQCEVTFGAGAGMFTADLVVLARSAIRQIAQRAGLLASFMCRPGLANMVANGWHLHQSLRDESGTNLFMPQDDQAALAPLGMQYLAGLLAHGPAGASFAAPTINGYRRYRPFTNAPDRANWGRDNRGVMVRVLGGAEDAATRLENRLGEPAANPYLYMASQIVSGLDGIDRALEPGASADSPYETAAPPLPNSLEAALAALRADEVLRDGFGGAFIDYWLHLKQAEITRFQAEVSAWEQREYFGVF